MEGIALKSGLKGCHGCRRIDLCRAPWRRWSRRRGAPLRRGSGWPRHTNGGQTWKTKKDEDETCPKRHGSGIARLRDTRSFGAAFERQVLTLQTLVQVLDGSLKGPGAASSGDQTRSVNDLIQDDLRTDKGLVRIPMT